MLVEAAYTEGKETEKNILLLTYWAANHNSVHGKEAEIPICLFFLRTAISLYEREDTSVR